MDGNGFRKLRIGLAAAVAGAGVVPALAEHAEGFPVITTAHTPYHHTSNYQTKYGLGRGEVGSPFATSLGFGLIGGSFGHETTGTVPHCTGHGSFGPSTSCTYTHPQYFAPSRPNAFNAGFNFSVAGSVFTNPSGTVVGHEPDWNAGGTLPDALSVSYQIHRYAAGNFRILFSVTNSGTETVKAPVVVGTNLGSNAMTTVEESSNGNKKLDRTDSWFITDAGQSGSTPITLLARGDRNKKGTHWLVKILRAPGGAGHSNEWVERRVVKIKPGQTVRFLYFARLSIGPPDDTTTADYQKGAAVVSSGLVSDITPDTLAEIVNWKNLAP